MVLFMWFHWSLVSIGSEMGSMKKGAEMYGKREKRGR